jgi:hypothetical protein
VGIEPTTYALKDHARRRTLPSTCDFSPSCSHMPCLGQHRSTSFRVTFDVTGLRIAQQPWLPKPRIPNPLTMRVREPRATGRGANTWGSQRARRGRAGWPRESLPWSAGVGVESGEEVVEDFLAADLALVRGVVALPLEGGAELHGGLEERAGLADELEVAVQADRAGAVAVAASGGASRRGTCASRRPRRRPEARGARCRGLPPVR